MEIDKAIKILERFHTQAQTIRKSRLVTNDRPRHLQTSLKVNLQKGIGKTSFEGVDDNDLRSVLLALRLAVDGNRKADTAPSFQDLSKVYLEAEVDPSIRKQFDSACDEITKSLDSSEDMSLNSSETRRDVWNQFLNDEYFHDDKRPMYDEVSKGFFRMDFVETVLYLIRMVLLLQCINALALMELKERERESHV